MSIPTRNRTEHQLDLTTLETVYHDAVGEAPHLHARYRTALAHLKAQKGAVVFLGAALVVKSSSTDQMYAVNGTCQCAFYLNKITDRMCPHRCAYDLARRTLDAMAKQPAPAPVAAPTSQASYLDTVALLASLGPELTDLTPANLDTVLGHLRTIAGQINAEYQRRGRAKPGMPAPATQHRAKK